MSKLQTGLYLYSVRKRWSAITWAPSEVAELGYKNIELSFESPHLARLTCLGGRITNRDRNIGSDHRLQPCRYHSYRTG